MDVIRRALRHDVGIDVGFLLPLVMRLRVADVGVGHVDVADTGTVSRIPCHDRTLLSLRYAPQGTGEHFLRKCNNPL